MPTTKTRIYVCGSQSVGKTTLCRELACYLGYEVVPEAARDIMNSKKIDFKTMERDIAARDTFQIAVFDEHMKRHDNALREIVHGDKRGRVFDRGIDYLVYAASFSTQAFSQFDCNETKRYIDTLKQPESLVVLLEPYEQLMQQDDVRAGLNMKSAYEVTFGIKVLLEVFGIPYIHITTPDTLARVKLVANIVRQT